jgi:hypothetical protein
LVDGVGSDEIAKSFFAQAETQLEYASASEFVTKVYQNTLEPVLTLKV